MFPLYDYSIDIDADVILLVEVESPRAGGDVEVAVLQRGDMQVQQVSAHLARPGRRVPAGSSQYLI